MKQKTDNQKSGGMFAKTGKQLATVLEICALLAFVVFSFTTSGSAMWEKAYSIFSLDRLALTEKDAPFSIHVIDVGAADAILLECDGKTMLVDSGRVLDGEAVSDYLSLHGVRHLDYALVTHLDEDHAGGFLTTLQEHTPSILFWGPYAKELSEGELTDQLLSVAEDEQIALQEITAGDVFSLGEAVITVLGPLHAYTSPNDTSLVFRVDYEEFSALFCGDVEQAGEDDLVDAGAALKADWIKIAHHGSDTSSSKRFLNQVQAKWAAVSSDEMPSKTLQKRMSYFNMNVFQTCSQGNLLFFCEKTQAGLQFHIATEQGEKYTTIITKENKK